MEMFDRHGISFPFPEHWELTEQEQDEMYVVNVNSPGTAFWSVALFRDRPEPDAVLDTALAAFRNDYPDLDIYRVDDEMLSQPAMGYDLEFFCLELLNTAHVRSFLARDFTVLVMCQADDTEWDAAYEMFLKISGGLICEMSDEDDWVQDVWEDLERPK